MPARGLQERGGPRQAGAEERDGRKGQTAPDSATGTAGHATGRVGVKRTFIRRDGIRGINGYCKDR